MKIRYLDWKEGAKNLVDRFKLLEKIFSYFLVREDGDVDRALEFLEAVGNHHGLFDDELSFEDLKKHLAQKRLVAQTPDGFALTPRGEQFVRTESLQHIFNGLKMGPVGDHRTNYTGVGAEKTCETRPYRFGDDVADIDFVSSFKNRMVRDAAGGSGLTESDLEVFESEAFVSVATCLLVDVSHSMILYGEDRITPAKRVALALTELILTKFPKDAFHVILFGDDAREIPVKDLVYSGVGPYHTNTHAALRLARQILMRKKHANRQIFMITDGKPTALLEEGGLYINTFGADRKIINKTLDEAAECRRYGIPITTFMLARDPMLVHFVEEMTRTNKGRAYFASLDGLEQSVFVDFLQNRRRKVR